MGIPMWIRWRLYIETDPWSWWNMIIWSVLRYICINKFCRKQKLNRQDYDVETGSETQGKMYRVFMYFVSDKHAKVIFSWLTLWVTVTYVCVSKLSHHCFNQRPVTSSGPSHHLGQWLFVVKCTLGNTLQWSFDENTTQLKCLEIKSNEQVEVWEHLWLPNISNNLF